MRPAIVSASVKFAVLCTLLSDTCSFRALRLIFRHCNSDRITVFRLLPLLGLRSSDSSEELRQNPQFRSSGLWTVSNLQNGMKLADCLGSIAACIFTSQTACKNAIRKGLIRLNGAKAQNTDVVSEGDIIESFVRNQQGTFCSEFEQKVIGDPSGFERCTVPVLWEDDHCAVVVKPQGMPVFRMKESSSPGSVLSSGTDNESYSCLQTALPYSLTSVPDGSDLQPLRRPQAVHRLDKGTGGLLLVAKTRPALVNLTAQFSDRTVKKTYTAVVVGKLSDETQSEVVEHLVESRSGESELPELHPPMVVKGSVTHQLSGQVALTDWTVRPGMQTRSPLYGWITTVDLSPHTGRTHQLRR